MTQTVTVASLAQTQADETAIRASAARVTALEAAAPTPTDDDSALESAVANATAAITALTARVAALEAAAATPLPAPAPAPVDDDSATVAAEAADAAAITALTSRVTALEATPASSSTTAVPVLPGVVQLDWFTATSDDAKLTAALSYAAAQTHIPAIMFPARDVTLSQMGRQAFSGLKLIGPLGADGPKDPEQGAALVNHSVKLTGTGAWFTGSGNLFNVQVRDLSVTGTAATQFWSHSSGTLYACEFHSLTHIGFGSVFGSATEQCHFTQVRMTGHWQNQGAQGQQFNIGGSDNDLWAEGYLNINAGSNVSPGTYLIQLWSSKTRVGYVYLTAWGGWRGLHVTGGHGLRFFGGSYEGNNAGQPCQGNHIRIDGGEVGFTGIWTAYGMASSGASEHGVIEVNGGTVLVDNPTYDHGNTGASVPLVWVNGGRVEVRSVQSATADVPVVHAAGGTLTHDGSVTVA